MRKLTAAAGIVLLGMAAARGQRVSGYGEAPVLPAGPQVKPKAGPVEVLRSSEVKRGMRGVAWTVFEGTEPEAVPVEILGLWKNSWGPGQDVILGKLGGKAAKTNVAGGMSGSPVYVDGKLIGAIALRISVFSQDAICGITPIEHMLEIKAIDETKPTGGKAPQLALNEAPAGLAEGARLVPIETPLSFAGFHAETLREFQPYFQQMGMTAVQGGAAGALQGAAPVAGWQTSLQPGQMISGILMSGDLTISGLGTVTYNDGKRVIGFGHSFFNLGALDMPMAGGEVLLVLSSQYQPNKMANATGVVGALRQDRHSGILGELGATAPTVPVTLKVRTQPQAGAPYSERTYHYRPFVHPKWTPFLMMLSTYNSVQDINAGASDEATFRIKGTIELEGLPKVELSTVVASSDAPMPAGMQIASWWADKFNRLMANTQGVVKFKRVDLELEMTAERRLAAIEAGWLDEAEVRAGEKLRGKVALRPWRAGRRVEGFEVQLPGDLAPGEYRLLVSDADTLNRAPAMVGQMTRTLDLGQTVALLNQERTNDRVYLSLVTPRPTVYADDQALSSVPSSVLNVMQSGRPARPLLATAETSKVVGSVAVQQAVTGMISLRFVVR